MWRERPSGPPSDAMAITAVLELIMVLSQWLYERVEKMREERRPLRRSARRLARRADRRPASRLRLPSRPGINSVLRRRREESPSTCLLPHLTIRNDHAGLMPTSPPFKTPAAP